MQPSLPSSLSSTQRAFVEGAEALGATVPAAARPLPELPLLSRSELDELIAAGLVREAADWKYYVFRSRISAEPSPVSPDSSSKRGRFLKTALFWLIVILIPVVLVRLIGPR